MSDLTRLLDADLSLRVALTLLHFFWQGIAVAACAAIACAMLRRASASARYGTLLCAMTLMVACPVVTFALLQPAPVQAATAAAPVPVSSAPTPAPAPDAKTAPVLQAAPAFEAGAVAVAGQNHSSAAVSPPVQTRFIFPERLRPWAPWMTALYLAGALLMTARLTLALLGGQRLRRGALPLTDAHILQALARQSQRLGLRRVPVVAWCRRVASPAVVGVLRPMVLLPVALSSGMSAAQIESILAHELAHVRRLDPLVNVLQGLVEALLFFHPAVWFVSRRLRLERENCCDDMVLGAGGAPLDYVKSLVRAAELGLLRDLTTPGPAALAAVNHPSQLRQRIVRLLQGEPAPQLRVSPGPLLALILLAAVLTGAAWYRVARAQQAPDDSAPPATIFTARAGFLRDR